MTQPAGISDEVRLILPAGLTVVHGAAMATEFSFHLAGHDPGYLRQAATEVFHEFQRLEATLSFYRESSDVTRINRAAAGTEILVSADTMNLLLLSAEVATLTQGAFDAFTGRAASAAKNQQTPLHLRNAPEPAQGDSRGPVISLKPDDLLVCKLRAGPWLDLGALGKGYALDLAAAQLNEWSVTQGLLSAGGSSHLGLGGPNWILESGGTHHNLPGEFALGASGGRFQAGHIIDPRTAGAGIGTVRALAFAPTAALADALSTAAMLMSPVDINALVRQRPGTAFLIVNASGRAWRSGSFFG